MTDPVNVRGQRTRFVVPSLATIEPVRLFPWHPGPSGRPADATGSCHQDDHLVPDRSTFTPVSVLCSSAGCLVHQAHDHLGHVGVRGMTAPEQRPELRTGNGQEEARGLPAGDPLTGPACAGPTPARSVRRASCRAGGRGRPSTSISAPTASASADTVGCVRNDGGCPCPGRSTVSTSYSAASCARTGAKSSRVVPMPCSNTSGSPSPARSQASTVAVIHSGYPSEGSHTPARAKGRRPR